MKHMVLINPLQKENKIRSHSVPLRNGKDSVKDSSPKKNSTISKILLRYCLLVDPMKNTEIEISNWIFSMNRSF
jgi:hypothetical protein